MVVAKCLIVGSSIIAFASAAVASAQTSKDYYTYDVLGRLVKVETVGGSNSDDTRAICYDDAGNRTDYEAKNGATSLDCSSGAPASGGSGGSAPSISVSSGAATEGGAISFTITLSAAHSSSISVDYATVAGTAGTSDFSAQSGVVTIPAGQLAQSVLVPTTQDALTEFEESFSLSISNPTAGANISVATATGTILDDDTCTDPLTCV